MFSDDSESSNESNIADSESLNEGNMADSESSSDSDEFDFEETVENAARCMNYYLTDASQFLTQILPFDTLSESLRETVSVLTIKERFYRLVLLVMEEIKEITKTLDVEIIKQSTGCPKIFANEQLQERINSQWPFCSQPYSGMIAHYFSKLSPQGIETLLAELLEKLFEFDDFINNKDESEMENFKCAVAPVLFKTSINFAMAFFDAFNSEEDPSDANEPNYEDQSLKEDVMSDIILCKGLLEAFETTEAAFKENYCDNCTRKVQSTLLSNAKTVLTFEIENFKCMSEQAYKELEQTKQEKAGKGPKYEIFCENIAVLLERLAILFFKWAKKEDMDKSITSLQQEMQEMVVDA